jgi:hypothetical protein
MLIIQELHEDPIHQWVLEYLEYLEYLEDQVNQFRL